MNRGAGAVPDEHRQAVPVHRGGVSVTIVERENTKETISAIMASISRDKSGNRTIQVVCADGKRRSIRLGKMAKKAAESVKAKVETLNAANIAGISWDKETAEWVGGLESVLYDKLAAIGLLRKRTVAEQATLAAFVDEYLAKRSDIKPGTRVGLTQVRNDLVAYFGADKPLSDVTEGDADQFRLYLRKRLAENTVRRRCGRARQLFRAAVKHRLIRLNPFAEMKGITVQANSKRLYFITRDEAAKVLDACPDAQWRLLFALSRYGGLRCPSEHLGLAMGRRGLGRRPESRSTRPRRNTTKAKSSRVIPLFPELRPYLEAAWDEAESGTEFVITRYRDTNSQPANATLRIIRSWPG